MSTSSNIQKAIIRLQFKDPFSGWFLSQSHVKTSDKVKFTNINIRGLSYELVLNEKLVENISSESLKNILNHEMIHIICNHLLDRNKYSDKFLWDIACDIEANQFVHDLKTLLSDFPEYATLEKIEEVTGLTLNKRASADYYYQKLTNLSNQQKQELKNEFGSPSFQTESGDESEEGQGDESDEEGQGSGNGDKSSDDDIHSWTTSNEEANGNVDNLNELLKQSISNNVSSNIEEFVKSNDKSKGNLPASVQERLNLKLDRAKVDWRKEFRIFGTGAKTSTLVSTRKKESKRYPDAPGKKKVRHAKILFMIDVSGSVSTEELHEALNELYHLTKQGYEIDILQCDTEIKYYDNKKAVRTLTRQNLNTFDIIGRGGTCFAPALEYFNTHKQVYDAGIYFTDGGGDDVIKTYKKLLWLVSSNGTDKYLNLQNNQSIIKINK